MDVHNMTTKDIAVGVISMIISDGILGYDVSFEQVAEVNETQGWPVIFPVEEDAGFFRKRRVQLDETDLEIAWEQAKRLRGCTEKMAVE